MQRELEVAGNESHQGSAAPRLDKSFRRGEIEFMKVKSIAVVIAFLLAIVFIAWRTPYFCGSNSPEWTTK